MTHSELAGRIDPMAYRQKSLPAMRAVHDKPERAAEGIC